MRKEWSPKRSDPRDRKLEAVKCPSTSPGFILTPGVWILNCSVSLKVAHLVYEEGYEAGYYWGRKHVSAFGEKSSKRTRERRMKFCLRLSASIRGTICIPLCNLHHRAIHQTTCDFSLVYLRSPSGVNMWTATRPVLMMWTACPWSKTVGADSRQNIFFTECNQVFFFDTIMPLNPVNPNFEAWK